MVGHREGGHALAGRLGEQGTQPRGTVEHRILGVNVQVDERLSHVGTLTLGYDIVSCEKTARTGTGRVRRTQPALRRRLPSRRASVRPGPDDVDEQDRGRLPAV